MGFLYSAAWFLAGLGWGAWATVRFRRVLRVLHDSPGVPGAIVDRKRRQSQGSPKYSPVVLFRTLDGREIRATAPAWQADASVRDDGSLMVFYDEAKPTRIVLDGSGFEASAGWATVTFLLHVGVSVSIAALSVIFYLSQR